MNFRRFGFILVAISAALLALVLYTQSQQAKNKPAATAPAASPAAAPAAAPAPATAPQGGVTAVSSAAAAPAPVAPATAPAPGAPAPAAAPAPSAGTTGPQPGEWAVEPFPTASYLLGSQDPKTGYRFEVQLTNYGASIYTAKLADYYATADDKRLAEKLKDEAEYQRRAAASGGTCRGHYSLLNPLPKGAETAAQLERQSADGRDVSWGDKLLLPLATQRIDITSITYRNPQTHEDSHPFLDLAATRWKLQSNSRTKDSQTISFAVSLDRWNKPYLRVVKTYTVRPNDYSVEMSLTVENLSSEALTVKIGQAGPTGLPREDVRSDMRKLAFGRLQDQKVNVLLQDIANKDRDANPLIGGSAEASPVLWIGQTNKFFASMMYLAPLEGSAIEAPRPTAEYRADKVSEAPGLPSKTYATAVDLTKIELPARHSSRVGFNVFVGPKDRDLFNQPGTLYNQLNYISTIELSGGCNFCSFGWLALAIMWLLEHLAKWVTFGNYGVAIVILVIIVRVILHPLTKKGQVSMMKMQKLAPKMNELKEKYKDDKDTLQRETMKFYKEQGASPLLGCLPMLLQMPIWIALYAGLSADVALRGAAFLPVWITDLSGMDAVIAWTATPLYLPLVSGIMGPIVSLNLLPLLLTVAMYYQTKLTPTSMGATTPQQAQQQKMMKIMTPVMMLLFFYNAPAGLNLYIMTSTFSSVFEQIIIRRHIERRQALEAATETTVSMGKGPRDNRPKKPKGPGWIKHG